MKRIIFLVGLILVFTGTFVYGQEGVVEAKNGEKETDWVKKYEDAFNKGDANGLYEAAENIIKQKVSDIAFGQLLKIAKDKSKTTTGDIQFRCMTLELLKYFKNQNVFEELKNVAEDKDQLLAIRSYAIQQMAGASKDEKIFNYLTEKLKDPNQEIRAKAINKLGEPGNKMAGPYLLPLLNDSDEKIICASIAALGTMGYKDALDEITKNLNNKNEKIVAAAIFALRQMKDDKNVEALVLVLLDKNRKEFIRDAAAGALGEIKSDKAVDALIKVVEEGGYNSIAAAEALGELGNKKAVESIKMAIEKETDSFATKKYKEVYKKLSGNDYVQEKK